MSQFDQAKPAGAEAAAMPFARQEFTPLAQDLQDLQDLHVLAAVQPCAAAAVPAELHFSVRYVLPEYIHFMWQHGGYLIRRHRIGPVATYLMLARSTSTAALRFVLQGRSRRIYDYTVDGHGIVRATAGGVTLIPWTDVTDIRKYTRGFMLVMRRGTLPIPFRCLASGQRAALDAYACALNA